jgi:Fe-S oxidoreductase
MEGINIITDEKGNNKALILDLILFKKNNIKAESVLEHLKDLQKWIEETEEQKKPANTWEAAKSRLNQLKDL